MTAQLVWDAFKGLLISLRPPTIFPAAIFVLAQVYVMSCFTPGFEYDSTESVILWIGLIVLCSYMLHGIGFWLMHLFRGEGWNQTFLGRILQKGKMTEFGYIIQRGIEYPYVRYGMDWEVLRRCFEPILVEQKYQVFIEREKDILSLFMNMSAVSIILSLEFFYIFLFWGKFKIALAVPIIALGIIKFFYICMLSAAKRWSETIRTACDLYRHDLYRSLGLKPSFSADEEEKNWRAMSEFIFLNLHPDAKRNYYRVVLPQSELFGVKKIELFYSHDFSHNNEN